MQTNMSTFKKKYIITLKLVSVEEIMKRKILYWNVDAEALIKPDQNKMRKKTCQPVDFGVHRN